VSGDYTIHELVNEFRVCRRTIYRYIRRGVLPKPVGRTGRGAHYTHEHWRRLREIQRARDETVTLEDLRERFNG
jgi:DNA-binding transcriptional MerR regulator